LKITRYLARRPRFGPGPVLPPCSGGKTRPVGAHRPATGHLRVALWCPEFGRALAAVFPTAKTRAE